MEVNGLLAIRKYVSTIFFLSHFLAKLRKQSYFSILNPSEA